MTFYSIQLNSTVIWNFAGISFTPREVGDYLVNVYRHGQHIPNSPFKIYVGETEIGNAGRVKVYGRGLQYGMANELNEFFVNTKDAGQLCEALYIFFFLSLNVVIACIGRQNCDNVKNNVIFWRKK